MGMGKVVGIVEEKVAERYGPDAKDVRDMLGSFVRHGLKQDEANSEAVLLTLAGSDTTATVLRATLLHLINNPPALSRLHAEIDIAIANGSISSPAREVETRHLTYLQACIKEGLRIWPPANGFVEKEVPLEGDTFNGVYLPGGTHVGQSLFAIQRDPNVFGEDANMYRPERWSEADGEKIKAMLDSNDLVFGGGRFECSGKRVALIELQKVFVELLRRYNFAVVHPEHPWDSWNYGLFVQKNMWVRVTHRKEL
jgi:cytochrome P450